MTKFKFMAILVIDSKKVGRRNHNSELRRKEVKYTDFLSFSCGLLTNELEYRVKKVKGPH